MLLPDDWSIEDTVSGLRLSVHGGTKLNRLHIERLDSPPVCDNRDFFFTKDGEFDGTGSSYCEGKAPRADLVPYNGMITIPGSVLVVEDGRIMEAAPEEGEPDLCGGSGPPERR
jgi:hypothetical protein